MQPVERTDPEGVDFGWVMQVTFVVTILVGAPLVAVLSTAVTLETWGGRAAFAVRVGAVVWFVTAVAVYGYARYTTSDGVDGADGTGDDADRTDGDDDANRVGAGEDPHRAGDGSAEDG